MRLLMIGGTRFVGKHVVEAAIARGHDVTLFNRGRYAPGSFPGCTHLVGDRDRDLSALATGEWDATIDTCGYFTGQVTSLADALGGRGGQHVFVSSVSVYQDPPGPGIDEDAPLIELDDTSITSFVDGRSYGGLKAACERTALDRYGPSTLIVRPTYVIGPDDYSWRFPWWVCRAARGGEVLMAGPASDPAQVIDARDQAAWMVSMLERGTGGVFHTVGPSSGYTWGELMEAVAAAVAPTGTSLRWVDEQFLLQRGLDGEMLPMWAGGDPGRFISAVDPSRAFAAGLTIRPIEDTIRDTLAWARTQTQPAKPGITAEREAELLAEWSAATW